MLASAPAIRDETGLNATDAGRVARFLPEAAAYLRVLKGERWYRAMEALPRIVRADVAADPGPVYTTPPTVALKRPVTGDVVTAPAYAVYGVAEAAAGRAIARVEYRNGIEARWTLDTSAPLGQPVIEFGRDLPCAPLSATEPSYLTLSVRVTDSAGAATVHDALVKVLPPDVSGAEPSGAVPVSGPAVDIAVSEVLPGEGGRGEDGFGGTAPPDWAEDATPARPGVGLAPDFGTVAPVSAERFAAERAESLLALYYALPVLNLRLAADGGLVTTSWEREPDGSSLQTRFAAPESIDLLRRDLLTNAKLLVDGDVRVTYGGESNLIDGLDGYAGGSGYLGII